MKCVYISLFSLICIFILPSSKPDKKYYNEPYRPQFHFSPALGRQEAPVGLVHSDGEYHLFYRYIAEVDGSELLSLGHAVSSDLLHWEHLPFALHNGNTPEENCTVLSGSAIVDDRNLLGMQRGEDKTLVLFYTGQDCGGHIAYSTDRGRIWEKHEGNPVLTYDGNGLASGPGVVWHEASQRYVMVLCRRSLEDERSKGVSFYTSENLIDWEYRSHVFGFNDYPDLVPMQVSNRPEEEKWVLFDGDGSYIIGEFDGELFSPETAKIQSDFGRNYYAPQTWINRSEEKERVIQIAWMREGKFPGMPFNGQMTFPAELELTRFNFGYKVTRKPVAEIGLLQGKHYQWSDKKLYPGINQNIVKKVKGDCLHIIGEFDLRSCNILGFYIRNSKRDTGVELLYDVKRGTLSLLGASAPLLPVDNTITIEILVDRSSIEVFANGGQTVISQCHTSEKGSEGLVLFTSGGEVVVNRLDIYRVESAWRDK